MKNYTTKLVRCCNYFANYFEKKSTCKNLFTVSFLLSPLVSIAGSPTSFPTAEYGIYSTESPKILFAKNTFKINFKYITAPFDVTESIRTTLYLLQPDNSTILADGVYTEYNNLYHDSVTLEDATKFTNILENIGLVRYGKTLAVERRPIIKSNDTLFIKLWKTTLRSYQIELITNLLTNIGLQAFFVDDYLNTSTRLSLSSNIKINFTVNADMSSSAVNRFKIIFKPLVDLTAFVPLPVTFTSIKAYREGEKIELKWMVENETNISKYEIEKSLNGKDFSIVSATLVNKLNNISGNYFWVDNFRNIGSTFYRIKSVSQSGNNKYTAVIKVPAMQNTASFIVYPNPVIDNKINLQICNQPAGIYQVKLTNISGEVVYNNKLTLINDNTSLSLNITRGLLKGIYQLEIKNAANFLSQVKNILVQ